jgi:hypothetical protein
MGSDQILFVLICLLSMKDMATFRWKGIIKFWNKNLQQQKMFIYPLRAEQPNITSPNTINIYIYIYIQVLVQFRLESVGSPSICQDVWTSTQIYDQKKAARTGMGLLEESTWEPVYRPKVSCENPSNQSIQSKFHSTARSHACGIKGWSDTPYINIRTSSKRVRW